MPPLLADVEAASENFHIQGMKKYVSAPLAFALLAISLSGCVWWHHGYHDHGGDYGHGGYGHGGPGQGDYGHGGYGH
ncbi:hypothetical protein [Acidocella sp.]|jgi:hypothetical protein|uniref:hypothetical protein n=1 Tax=Acidocella sp. TaxID=50710 RepID=UPI002F3EB399